MAFHENKHISFFILLAYIVLAFFAAKLFFSVVFPWTIPLIISVIMSAVIEKPVKHLEKRKVPRKIASAVCTLFYLTLFGTLCYFIVSVTVSQVKILALELPGLAESLMDKLEIILANLEKTLSGLPLHKLGIDISSLDSLLSGIKLPDFKASYIINPVFKAAVSLPTILIFHIFSHKREKDHNGIYGKAALAESQRSPRGTENIYVFLGFRLDKGSAHTHLHNLF